jgi:hypothetical protein
LWVPNSRVFRRLTVPRRRSPAAMRPISSTSPFSSLSSLSGEDKKPPSVS